MQRNQGNATLRQLTCGFLVVSSLLGALSEATYAQATTDTIFKLVELNGPNGDNGSKAYGLNETGQIIGWIAAGENHHSTQWLNETVTDLHGTPHLWLLQIFNLDYTESFAISNGDQVVGAGLIEIECGTEKITVMHGMLLRPATLTDLGTPVPGDALTDFGTFGDPCQILDSAAIDISNRNHVVGWSDTAGGSINAFIVRPQSGVWVVDANDDYANDLMISLGTLSADSTVSSATSVNDFGEVTGYSYTAEASYHAFLVSPADTDNDGIGDQWFTDLDGDQVNDLMQDLGTLGGTNSWGRSINGSGQVVGESDTAALTTHAFLWQTGNMTDLGTLGGRNSSASHINESGQVVGWAEDATGQRRAFLWQNGVMVDLNDLLLSSSRLILTEAREINEAGQIVGWGYLPGSDTPQAFLLRAATADEIADAQPDDTDDTTDVPADEPDDSGPVFNEGPGDNPFEGVPMLGTPGQLAAQADDDENPDGDDAPVAGDVDEAPAPALCGVGAVGMVPLCMLGLTVMRRGRPRQM